MKKSIAVRKGDSEVFDELVMTYMTYMGDCRKEYEKAHAELKRIDDKITQFKEVFKDKVEKELFGSTFKPKWLRNKQDIHEMEFMDIEARWSLLITYFETEQEAFLHNMKKRFLGDDS